MQTLPNKIITMISEFCDKTTKYKLHMLLDYKVCCPYEKHQNCSFDSEEEFYYCDICKNFICHFCYESGEINVDDCYHCDKSICSHCNDDCKLLKDIWVSRCKKNDCYYCRRGCCYNNKIEWCCEDCIKESGYEVVDNGTDTGSEESFEYSILYVKELNSKLGDH
jgi:hypothetical protein